MVPKIRFPGFDKPWEQYELGDFSDVKTGPFGSTLHAGDYVSDGVPIITTEHFKTGILPCDKTGIPQVSDQDYERLRGYVLKEGDIVFSRVGSVDINALVCASQDGWLFSGRVLRVRIGDDVDSRFLHYLLLTRSVRNDVVSQAVGLIMPSINTEILRETGVVLPSDVMEQAHIGYLFCSLDRLVEISEDRLAGLEAFKTSMMQKVFSQQVRFVADDGSAFPEWTETRFGDFFTLLQSNTYSRDCLTYDGNGVRNIHYGDVLIRFGAVVDVSSADDVPVLKEGIDVSKFTAESYLRTGDVVFADTAEDEIVGKATEIFNPDGLPALSGLHTIPVRPKEPCAVGYLGTYVNSFEFRKELYSLMQGVKVVSISKSALQAVVLRVPSLPEQRKIAAFFASIDDAIAAAKDKLAGYQDLKKAMLQRMFV